jgi:hypothetical protein
MSKSIGIRLSDIFEVRGLKQFNIGCWISAVGYWQKTHLVTYPKSANPKSEIT